MLKYMRNILLIVAVILTLCSCGKHETEISGPLVPETPLKPEEGPKPVHVTLSLVPSRQTQITWSRTVSESAIRDVHLYIFGNGDLHPVEPVRSQEANMRFECLPGRYEMFVLTNAGSDLGPMTRDELLRYELSAPDSDDHLIMTARRNVLIAASPQSVTLEPMEVTRCAAKISYRIGVASEAGDIRLHSVQVLNMPQRVRIFDANYPSQEFADKQSSEVSAPGQLFSNTFFMLPNLQGDVPGITDQTQKCPANAPPQATCLRIRATRDTKVLDYYVYLGRNNTSNFDVCANTQYSLDITIRGDNESDVRVQSYTVAVECTPLIAPSDGFLLERTPLKLTLRLAGSYLDAGISVTLEIKSGNKRFFRVDGIGDLLEHSLHLSGPENMFEIRYFPHAFTRTDCRFEFTVHIRDKFGEVTAHDFSFCYAHSAKIYTKWFDGMQGDGIISSEDALGCVKHMTLSSIYYMFYLPDEGCTLVATPNENRQFEGWSRTHDHTGDINYDPHYRFNPLQDPDTIYAYFR